ncbi:NAD(+) synthase [Sphingomonas morindae]|uniref:Glutamine-dependent NAD(+) synthetase n=1 Tax=Sphingomonas morindae TaxID=1541170 RepID=A0ABY4X3C2_9SPHN|nr:NAD(+) synthase [Sphingomonas morindae]USI71380.1 NAD(+) synthase [Sphingomonas morindae]
MATAAEFRAIHSHGFVRVGAATPPGTAGDPAANGAAIRALAEAAAARQVDLLVFPELALSSYAIDDLHHQEAMLAATEAALADLLVATEALAPVLVVGAPVRRNGRLYNCALVLHRGRLLGVVPKIFLPNYREYYEKRWFASGAGLVGQRIALAGQDAPFGADLLFAAEDLPHFLFAVETCEDFWAPIPPSTETALAGALILCNLSASNVTIGKARDRAMLAAAHSARTVSAYVFSAAGPGESTTDLAWDGQSFIYELGIPLAEGPRFAHAPGLLVADVDAGRLAAERMRFGTFNDAAQRLCHPEQRVRRIAFHHGVAPADIGFARATARFPFVPADPARLDEDCYEAFNIQVEGLAKRLAASGARRLVIGVSGGLDSTHALIVAAKAFDRLGRSRADILGFTMPGFATGEATKGNAWALMRALGIAADEIDIRPAARQMLADMDHPFGRGEPVYDVTFENVQAGLRTDYLFRLANQREGLVLGTGDLSELALGWCTYGVGDQMSHYAVNAGVPKTLIQFLIRWCIATGQYDPATNAVLEAILATEISPELVPADAEGGLQSTEDKIGPYALNDFFLHHIVRFGMSPAKTAFLAWHAWRDAAAGHWPDGVPEAKRVAYDLATIRHWLALFLRRFFGMSQFKRSAIPNGPKVSSGGALSPRGDWRAPADGTAAAWLAGMEAIPER